MRPTIDGLNADQWFAVARIGTELLLLGVALWMVVRYCVRAVRFLREEWEAERVRRERHEQWLEFKRRMSRPGERYGKEIRPPYRVQ